MTDAEKILKYDIYERVYKHVLFSLQILKIVPKSFENQIILNQLVRALTSIGANLNEASGSESKNDFLHKMAIARKEAKETLYWLRLLKDFNKINEKSFNQAIIETEEIVKILSTIVIKIKARNLNNLNNSKNL